MWFINIIGLIFIALIIWWFWLYKPKIADNANKVILVNNGIYKPGYITLPAHQESILIFKRLDPSPCSEVVIIPDLDISETLPINKEHTISIPATAPGKYHFHCQMQMYRGQLNIQ